MDPSGRRSALVMGAVSRDFISGAHRSAPGGVVFHAGSTLARLDAQVRVITRVRPADREALLGPLQAEQVEILALPSRATTTYRLDYRGSVDVHELRASSDPIGPEDIPEAWRHADLVHLGPLHPDDLRPEVAAVLRGFIGLDVQGLVRVPGASGTRLEASSQLASFLTHVDVLKASEHELAALLCRETVDAFRRRHGIRELLVTHGARGATLVTAAGETLVPATPTIGTATVGAGDVFLAAYLLLRVSGREPLRATREASGVAALKILHGQVPKGAPLEAE